MFDLKKFEEMNFFAKRDEIFKDNEKFGIENVLLPKPMLSASAGELQLILITNHKFTFENRVAFVEKLTEVFGKAGLVSIFEEAHVKSAIKNNVGGMAYVYEDFLQSAIPISALRQDMPLENQWVLQRNSAMLAVPQSAALITPLASAKKISDSTRAKQQEVHIKVSDPRSFQAPRTFS